MRHEYGGLWTRVKLTILENYLKAFTTALRRQFTLHYADAFAGTGSQDMKLDPNQPELIPVEKMKGSVQIALDAGEFHRYHFNDLSPAHYRALVEVRDTNPSKDIELSQLDANVFVADFCNKLTRNDRAVLFIDPYATEVRWETLQVIAATNAVDLWLLFPISSLARMTPKKVARLPLSWEKRITTVLGTEEWKSHLYRQPEKPLISDLFGDGADGAGDERIDFEGLKSYVSTRLQEIFAFTSQPITLKRRGSPLFLFYFCMSNKSPKAKGLAQKLVHAVTKKFQRL